MNLYDWINNPKGKQEIAERREKYLGKRVRFISFGAPDPDPLEPGDTGLVTDVDDIGTLGVNWDSGRRLGICIDDKVELI